MQSWAMPQPIIQMIFQESVNNSKEIPTITYHNVYDIIIANFLESLNVQT